MQNSSEGAFLYICQIFIFLFFLLCLLRILNIVCALGLLNSASGLETLPAVHDIKLRTSADVHNI